MRKFASIFTLSTGARLSQSMPLEVRSGDCEKATCQKAGGGGGVGLTVSYSTATRPGPSESSVNVEDTEDESLQPKTQNL